MTDDIIALNARANSIARVDRWHRMGERAPAAAAAAAAAVDRSIERWGGGMEKVSFFFEIARSMSVAIVRF